MENTKYSLKCPVCDRELYQSKEERTYRCHGNHCFDLAKEGYLNLLMSHEKKSKNPGDSQDMVVSRKKFLSKGFYETISDTINRVISDLFKNKTTPDFLLDIGCGEGYYLDRLIHHLNFKVTKYYGLDISKAAIKTASKLNKEALWLVGNNFFTPFKNKSLACLLSVFSPIDLVECKRILKADGVLVRVFPETNHLMQLKEIIYPEVRVKEYEQYLNDLKGLKLVDVKHVTYDVNLSNEDLSCLLLMTPHFWRVKEENKAALLKMASVSVTISVSIGVYKHENDELLIAKQS